jgi:hypothetical protein
MRYTIELEVESPYGDLTDSITDAIINPEIPWASDVSIKILSFVPLIPCE